MYPDKNQHQHTRFAVHHSAPNLQSNLPSYGYGDIKEDNEHSWHPNTANCRVAPLLPRRFIAAVRNHRNLLTGMAYRPHFVTAPKTLSSVTPKTLLSIGLVTFLFVSLKYLFTTFVDTRLPTGDSSPFSSSSSSFSFDPKNWSALSKVKSEEEEPHSANATLDFQEIVYLNMDFRTDRTDAMSLVAGSSGLQMKRFSGVKSDLK